MESTLPCQLGFGLGVYHNNRKANQDLDSDLFSSNTVSVLSTSILIVSTCDSVGHTDGFP